MNAVQVLWLLLACTTSLDQLIAKKGGVGVVGLAAHCNAVGAVHLLACCALVHAMATASAVLCAAASAAAAAGLRLLNLLTLECAACMLHSKLQLQVLPFKGSQSYSQSLTMAAHMQQPYACRMLLTSVCCTAGASLTSVDQRMFDCGFGRQLAARVRFFISVTCWQV